MKNTKTLKAITAPIFEDIKLFEKEFRIALHSEVRLVNTIGKYLLRHKGKHIRPMLTILASRICGGPSLNSFRAAVMIELLHIATLVHDDVVDEATKRHGFLSINKLWKNKVAVLMGDFLLSKALINMTGIKDFEALKLISHTAELLSAGEILQIEKSITRSMTEEVYFDMIYQKTASLVAASCELGALTTSGTKKDRLAMRTFGTKLGMAFQVKDDLFDLLGDENKTGKDMGADVKRNMMTLPLIHAYSNLSGPASREIKRILNKKRKSARNLSKVKEIISGAGGFDYAYAKIDEFNNQALDAIAPYPESVYKQSMVDLLSFNTHRNH